VTIPGVHWLVTFQQFGLLVRSGSAECVLSNVIEYPWEGVLSGIAFD
jgi:hypothetical protein